MNLSRHSTAYLNRLRATYTNRCDLHKAATVELNRRKRARARKTNGYKNGGTHYVKKYGRNYAGLMEFLGVTGPTVTAWDRKSILKHRIRLMETKIKKEEQ